MKQPKITENLPKGQDKDNANNWKSKAISRGKEIARLQKRIKELEKSRDGWKKKHHALKYGAGADATAESAPTDLSGEKARWHQYSIVLIALVLELQKYGAMSLRSCRHSVACMLCTMELSVRVPSHTTIRSWLCKGGLHRIQSGQAQQGDYVVYVDESIVLGQEKILLILGIPAAKIAQDRAVVHSDMEVLYVGANTEWKGAHIAEKMAEIEQTKDILYVVSDNGHNLRNAYQTQKTVHIEDCTHVLANYVKHLYEKDPIFIAFCALTSDLRRRWVMHKDNRAHMPPSMRGKLRFANIFPCVAWAERCLANWETLSESVREHLSLLHENTTFIADLSRIAALFKTMCKVLKNEGFGLAQHTSLRAIFTTTAQEMGETQSTNVGIFIQNCTTYLDNLSRKSDLLAQPHLLASSDIIESFFGKFKTKINANNYSGMTEFLFTIANFTQPFSLKETKKALETIKIKDLILTKKHPTKT